MDVVGSPVTLSFSHLIGTTLKVKMENGKVLSDTRLMLLCASEKFGCESTSLNTYACIWDYPDTYAISNLRTEEVKMLKLRKKYCFISGAGSSSKFVFEVRNNPQKHCGKPSTRNPTKHDSLCMDRISEHFDMYTVRNFARAKNRATRILEDPRLQKKGEFGRLFS